MTAKWNREEQLAAIAKLDAYRVRTESRLKELKADGVVLEHKKTGARIFLLLADDPNKVFTIGFRTPPQDSTGVAHIVEHTVLCGSEKYWAKDPFMELVKGSLNTFLNAMTYPDRTVYPVASCNRKDFENLMDVYLDAVFHPLFYKEEKIFRQEGWRYELESEDAKLVRNGVVYNEMKGAYSDPDQVLERAIDEALFPGHPYAEESGGDPDFIPDLTYEAYLDFHRRYYHPSNSFIYLYGDLDMAERLRYLDENYLSKYERLAIDSAIPAPKRLSAPVFVSRPYSIGETESEERAAYVSLNLRVGGQLDPVEYSAYQALDYVLLKAPGALLHDALIEEGFGDDVYGGYANGIREPYFQITAKHLRREQKDSFLRRVRELLSEIAEEGLDHEMLLAAINMAEFRAREANFGSAPKGLVYGLQSFESWIYDADPCLHLKYAGLFDELRRKVGENYFENLIRESLLENENYAVVELYPVRGLTAKHEAEDEERLAAKKAAMSPEEREALIAFGKEMRAYQDAADSEAALRTIPMLSREDLAAENEPLNFEAGKLGETPFHYAPRNTTGILYLRLDFDVSDLPTESLSELSLIKDLLGYLNTEAHSYGVLSTLVNLHTGGIQFGIDNYPDLAEFRGDRRVFSASVKFLPENAAKAIELVNEQLLGTQFNDRERVRNLIGEIRAGLKDTLLSAGHIAAVNRAASYFSESGVFQDVTKGIAYYRFLEGLTEDAALTDFSERAKAVLAETVRSGRLLIHLTAEPAGKAAVLPLLTELPARYPAGGKGELRFRFAEEIKREGFGSASRVNYVARIGNFRTGGFRYTGALRIAQTMLSYGYLWNEIRSKGGAYGCAVRFGRGGSVVFSSYRDPKLEETDKVYEGVPGYLEQYEADEREMTKAIIGAIGEMDTPRTPQLSGLLALSAYYSKVTDEMFSTERAEVLAATPEDIRALAPLVREALKYEAKCVIGNEGAIARAKDFFTETAQLFAAESEETEA